MEGIFVKHMLKGLATCAILTALTSPDANA